MDLQDLEILCFVHVLFSIQVIWSFKSFWSVKVQILVDWTIIMDKVGSFNHYEAIKYQI